MADIDKLVLQGIFRVSLDTLGGVVGRAILPMAAVAASTTVGSVAISCVLGSTILYIPYLLLKKGMDWAVNEHKHPLTHWLAMTTISIGMTIASAVLGAAILGLAATDRKSVV